jgi:ribosomal protein L6P/L9E
MIIFKFKNKNKFYLFSYLYSSTYFFYLPLVQNFLNLYYDKQIKVLSISSLFINNFFSIYWTFIKKIFLSFSKIFFKKLKFKGKGYYIYKSYRNTIGTQFGYSHMTRLFGYLVSLKFVTKSIILIYGMHQKNIYDFGHGLFKKRPHNIFTGKGVRFSKQIIYKKTGKISSYR